MATSSAKVLVTGATGYVGGHVVKALQEAGHKVRGTVRSVKNTDKVKHLYNLCPQAAHPLELVEADLNVPESWLSAVAGMDYVMHVASPVSIAAPKNEDEVIRPALDGTLSVLRACAKETSIRRVVITSSIVAVFDSRQNSDRPLTEDDWADVSSATSYSKSKIMAEKAAWDFVKTLDGDARFELAVINPGYILGPPLNATQSSSFEILPQLLERKMRMVPHVNVPIIDVRDLALAHLAAMTSREAAGHRHICTGHNLWIPDMAAILKCVFGPQGYNVPTSLAPKPLLWVASLFSGQVKTLMSLLDKVNTYDNTRMRKVLKVEPRDVQDTLVEMAYTLIEKGIVKRTPEYRGPGYNVPTSLAPKPLLWVASLFSGQVKTLMSLLDKVNTYDNTRMRKVLKVEPRDVQDTLVEMAYTLIEKGIVKRTPEYRGPGYNVPTSLAPKPLLWVASLFSGQVKTLMSLLDKVNTYDNTRMRKVLKVEPRDVQDTLVEMAYTLIEKGIVKRTPEYRGPGGPEEKKLYMKVRIS